MSGTRRLPSDAERLVLAAQAVAPDLRLVGGAGLSLLLGHRKSDDIDLFRAAGEDIAPVAVAVERAARDLGRTATRVRTGPGFIRLEISSGSEVLRVDLAVDSAGRLEPEPVLVGAVRVETLRDQRANKLVALLGRSELRDVVDLWFIEKGGLPAIDGLLDATAKDGGMDPAWLAWATKEVKIRQLPGLVAALDLDELTAWRDRLAAMLLDAAGAKVE
jgi:hypothetical protein